MNLETVLYEVVDGVAVVTLNRPEAMNAWTPQLSDELNLAMGAADEDDNVRAVVVTGAGKAFCGGADIREFDTPCGLERWRRWISFWQCRRTTREAFIAIQGAQASDCCHQWSCSWCGYYVSVVVRHSHCV